MSGDIVIIGGGPAGSAAAIFLCQAGLSPVLYERSIFPRFSIGESLLPASNPLFERLGVSEEMERRFITKPGGRWIFSHAGEMVGDFTSKGKTAYLVRRDELDALLLERARSLGAEVVEEEYSGLPESGRMIFDCSGRSSYLAREMGRRRGTGMKRMSIYAHYEGEILNEYSRGGWFLGETFYDGWIWLIRLSESRVSVGVVCSPIAYKRSGLNAGDYLAMRMERSALVSEGLRVSGCVLEPRATGVLGYACERLHGEGWVLAGDAGGFIDPCWSPGYHLALESAERAVCCYLSGDWSGYTSWFHDQERYASRMAQAFYAGTRSWLAAWFMILGSRIGFLRRRMLDFTMGEFTSHKWLLNTIYLGTRFIEIADK